MEQRKWREFEKAREFVRRLGLRDQNEWFAYARGDLRGLKGKRPEDIPFNPAREYRHEGYRGIRDWLHPPGGESIVEGALDYRRARQFARSLGLRDSMEWERWCQGKVPSLPPRPATIPERPDTAWPGAWRGWAEWLGTGDGRPARRYLPFPEAREFARGLGLRNVKEWLTFCRGERPDLGTRPPNVPANPESIYLTRGWKGYGDWLGTGNVAAVLYATLPFEEARALARRLGITTGDEWRAWTAGRRPDLPRPPPGVPVCPHRSYADCGWKGWGDFLGTGNVAFADRIFRPFEEAREFARSLGLGGARDWREFARTRRPADIPAGPDFHYASEGWAGWGDFLGTGNRSTQNRRFRPFVEARAFVRTLGFGGHAEYQGWLRGERPGHPSPPDDLPSSPDIRYREEGWGGWPDFLGHGTCIRREMPFEEARAFVRSLGLRARRDWYVWIRGDRSDLPGPPEAMPRSPGTSYRGRGWAGWGDFLGTGSVANCRRVFRPIEEARAFIHSLGIRSRGAWRAWLSGRRPDLPPRPADIPANPDHAYRRHGFTTWAGFFGTESPPRAPRRPPDP